MSTSTRFEKEAKGNSEIAYLISGLIIGSHGLIWAEQVKNPNWHMRSRGVKTEIIPGTGTAVVGQSGTWTRDRQISGAAPKPLGHIPSTPADFWDAKRKSLFSNGTGTSDDDGWAHGIVWILF